MEINISETFLKKAGIFLFILFVIFLITQLFQQSDGCDIEEGIKERSFNGKVIDKYIDQYNHEIPALKLSTRFSYSKEYFLRNEKSGFYDFVQVGDSLFKGKGSLVISLTRNEKDTFFIIDYGCEK